MSKMPKPLLSDTQVSVLNALQEQGTWYKGCGWYWSNDTQTQRSLEAIATKAPHLVHRGPHHVYYAPLKVTSVAKDIGAAAHCENGAEVPLREIEEALYKRVKLPTPGEIEKLVSGEENDEGADVPPDLIKKFPELHALLDKYMT